MTTYRPRPERLLLLRRLVTAAENAYNVAAKAVGIKSIESESSAFEDDLGELVQEILRGSGRLSKAEFRSQMKSMLKNYSESIAAQGWEEGGGDVEDIGPEELEIIQTFYTEQQSHVNDFSDWLKDKESDLDDAKGRIVSWVSSLVNLGQQMMARAMGDPPLLYDGDDGGESCDECQEYKGQVHRLSWWEARGLTKRNGNPEFSCGRWDACHHSFFHAKTGDLVIE